MFRLMCFLVMIVALCTPARAETSIIHGGTIASAVLDWLVVAFGSAIGAVLTAIVVKALNWIGIRVSQSQRDQLQAIVVNGVNIAADRAGAQLSANRRLDINVKNRIVAEAVAYTQAHAADTIKALGLDPKSGPAVEAIRARIATALADPNTPTDPVVTPVLLTEDKPK